MLPHDYIKNGKIKCLICGRYFVRPISHVWQKHAMTAREYKSAHGLDLKKGIATDEYRQIMRDHVMHNGTLNNLKKGAVYRFRKGQSTNYTRSEQTMDRLKTHFARVRRKDGRAVSVPKIEIKCAECGSPKMIYPHYYQKENNFCGVRCRNININKKRHEKKSKT